LSQLRRAYLERVNILHPDKCSSLQDQDAHKKKFVQLQTAWEEYNESIRMFRKTTSNSKSEKQGDIFWDDDHNNNFTMFGVGCSFSDTPEERSLRNEIMDQACKGWFPSGSLSHSTHTGKDTNADLKCPQKPSPKLSDDDMFMQQQTSEASSSAEVQAKKSLVKNVENYTRRSKR
jgi:hypothetical protein